MKKLNLLLVSTYGVGLGAWKKSGLYDREIGYCKKLLSRLGGEFGIFAYDRADEKPAGEKYGYFFNQKKLPALIFSLIWPFSHRGAVKKYDIVKSNQFAGAWTAAFIKLLDKRKVFVMRGGYAWQYSKKGGFSADFLASLSVRFSMNMADLIFFVSEKDKEEYLEKYGEKHRPKCRIVPNCIDTELFRPAPKKDGGKIKIILAGRLVEMKNFQSVIEAVSLLDTGSREKISLEIVGHGEYEKNLKELALKKNIDCKFWGALQNDELARVLGVSDIFIMPQLYGSGMSKALLEAMAAGNIVIGSDIEAHKNTIEDGIDGFLCGTDPKSIAQKLSHIIENWGSQEINSMREKALKKMREVFSMEGVSALEEKYIREAVVLR